MNIDSIIARLLEGMLTIFCVSDLISVSIYFFVHFLQYAASVRVEMFNLTKVKFEVYA